MLGPLQLDVTAREAVDFTRPPKSIFILGAGAIGCEFTELFSTFGTKVYLADITPAQANTGDDGRRVRTRISLIEMWMMRAIFLSLSLA